MENSIHGKMPKRKVHASLGSTKYAYLDCNRAREPAEVPGLGFWAFWGPRAVDQLGTHLN